MYKSSKLKVPYLINEVENKVFMIRWIHTKTCSPKFLRYRNPLYVYLDSMKWRVVIVQRATNIFVWRCAPQQHAIIVGQFDNAFQRSSSQSVLCVSTYIKWIAIIKNLCVDPCIPFHCSDFNDFNDYCFKVHWLYIQ